MNSTQLKSLQTPLKNKYKEQPESAQLTLQAVGSLEDGNVACDVNTDGGIVRAGLHPATGGDGSDACSAEMLLQSLVACAGVTLRAVATAMEIPIHGGTLTAEADLDFRGTLGVNKDVPVGIQAIRLRFDLDTDALPAQVEKLIQLTERYCVIYQTLRSPPQINISQTAR